MGFDIQIRHSGRLVIPKDSGYVPPDPRDPGHLRFSGTHMFMINRFMAAVGAIDPGAISPDMADTCVEGKVPAYKFNFNDGELITAQEAATIAEALGGEGIFSPPFLKKHLKYPGEPSVAQIKELRELLGLWAAFNRVAAANGGYIVS